MVDLSENTRKLENLEKRLTEMGDSLWHSKAIKKVKRIRSRNTKRRFLVRY